MSRITIATAGSRGDVQPYLALGLGLADRGHAVRLATYGDFEEWIRSYGLDFAKVEGDPQAMLRQEEGQNWVESGRRGSEFARGFRELVGPALYQATDDALDACADADLVIYSGPAFYGLYSVVEKLNLPAIQAYLQPIHPTRAFPSAIFPSRFGGHALTNYLTHIIGGQSFWQLMRPVVNDIRETRLDLPPSAFFGPFLKMLRDRLPVLYGFSPTILPRPSDWNEALHVTGFWFMPSESWEPPDGLREFLTAGPPPVYVGFGSMVSRDPARLTDTVLEALARSGQRGIILGGWAGLGNDQLPPSVMRVDKVPHNWLFPRMAAVVHHGGVGTTHAGLRAGRPSVVVPFFGDQPFWGDRILELGAGPTPIPQQELTAARLSRAIEAATSDAAIIRRANQLGEQIQAEDGVSRAVSLIEAYTRR